MLIQYVFKKHEKSTSISNFFKKNYLLALAFLVGCLKYSFHPKWRSSIPLGILQLEHILADIKFSLAFVLHYAKYVNAKKLKSIPQQITCESVVFPPQSLPSFFFLSNQYIHHIFLDVCILVPLCSWNISSLSVTYKYNLKHALNTYFSEVGHTYLFPIFLHKVLIEFI